MWNDALNSLLGSVFGIFSRRNDPHNQSDKTSLKLSNEPDAVMASSENNLLSTIERQLSFTKLCIEFLIITSFAWFLGYCNYSLLWITVLVAFRINYYYHSVHHLVIKEIRAAESEVLQKKLITDTETVTWMNFVINKWFIFNTDSIFSMAKDSLEPLLEAYKPSFLERISLTEFTFGKNTPYVRSFKSFEFDSPEDMMSNVSKELEASTHYRCVMEMDIVVACHDFNLTLAAQLKSNISQAVFQQLGLDIKITLSQVDFRGKCQVILTFNKAAPFPHLHQVSLMFTDNEPDIRFSLSALHADFMRLPLIKEWLMSLIKASLKETLYDPHVLPIVISPIQTEDTEENGSTIENEFDVKAAGVVIVNLEYGLGEADPSSWTDDLVWCVVSLNEQTFNTMPYPGNIPWKHKLAFMVHSTARDQLNIKLKTKGMLTTVSLADYNLSLTKFSRKVRHQIVETPKGKSSKGRSDLPSIKVTMDYQKLLMNRLGPDTISSALDQPNFEVVDNDNNPIITDNFLNSDESEDFKSIESRCGVFSIDVHSASNLPAMDFNGFSDPYVVVYFGSKKIKTSPPVKKTLNPVWDFHCDFMVEDFLQHPIKFEVYDWDGLSSKDDYIGCCYVKFSPEKSIVSQESFLLQMDDKLSKLYRKDVGAISVSAMFTKVDGLSGLVNQKQPSKDLFKGKNNNPAFFSSIFMPKLGQSDAHDLLNLQLTHSKSIQENKERLLVTILRANDLEAADKGDCVKGSSDPFCKILVDGKEKRRTRYVDRSLNPVWNETFNVKFPEFGLEIKVFDHDTIGADDFLGSFFLRFDDIKKIVGEVNSPTSSELTYQLGRYTGEVVIRLRLVDTKDVHVDEPEVAVNESQEVSNELKSLKSPSKSKDKTKIRFTIFRAENLSPADKSGTSDPFCKILIDGKEKGKTSYIDRTLNPSWNECFTTRYPRNGVEFKVYDHDTFGQDDFLGSVSLTTDEILEILNSSDSTEEHSYDLVGFPGSIFVGMEKVSKLPTKSASVCENEEESGMRKRRSATVSGERPSHEKEKCI